MSELIDMVVIGSGPAGQKAAIQAAKAGRRALVIELEVGVGGACVHRGTIPSKTLRETALALDGFRRRSGGVIDVKIGEDVQVASLNKRLDQVVSAHERFIADQLARNGIERWLGRASLLGPRGGRHAVRVTDAAGDSRIVAGEILVIATGSVPRAPPDIPIDHEHILDSDSILSLRYLPRSLTVLGGGVIACEYASIFLALGVDVTIIDRADRPLGFLDEEIAGKFVAAFERSGGRVIASADVREVTFDGVCSVVARLGDGRAIAAEKALVALGRVANVDGLSLASAGLAVDARGLLRVGEHGETGIPRIYAVGDVTGPPSLASAAMEQGRVAACHALGLPHATAREGAPAGIYTIPEIATVGLSEADARKKLGGAVIGRARFDEIARGQIAAIEDGMLKLVVGPDGKKLLGVQVVGEGAADLVHVGQMAILAGLDVDVFIDNVFNFPTLAEAYRVAALDVTCKRGAGLARADERALASSRKSLDA